PGRIALEPMPGCKAQDNPLSKLNLGPVDGRPVGCAGLIRLGLRRRLHPTEPLRHILLPPVQVAAVELPGDIGKRLTVGLTQSDSQQPNQVTVAPTGPGAAAERCGNHPLRDIVVERPFTQATAAALPR